MSTWKYIADCCRVPAGKPISLARDFRADDTAGQTKTADTPAQLERAIAELFDWQDRFYAEASRSLLIVLQATDAAGKDGTIKHVMSGLNPEGVDVYSFKQPSAQERSHDFLWRHVPGLPALGKISIFNRSHYENVLICRVHPELIWPASSREVPVHELWKRRYREINDWERYLSDNGTVIVKIFLNLSKGEQRRRFLARIDTPDKNWKFSAADLKEREYWDQYQAAFEAMINHTTTEWAPWHVVPADHKWFAHLAVSSILLETMRRLNPSYPTVSEADRAELVVAKEQILGKDPAGDSARKS